jgi:hypothetical protein
MTRITHFKQQPINVQYWDYYILCHLNTDATLALQRMEYWDGTKDDSNTHAEATNDAMAKSGIVPNQDTSYWVYKSLDELQWELMGASGERRLPKLVDFLIKELEYLDRRSNPFEGWDRKKQYKFNAEVVQEHINYLGYIISYFNLPLRHLRPVFCAIEALTKDKVYIDTINVDMVLEKMDQFKDDPKTPHFLKGDLEKFDKHFMRPHVRPFRTFAEWKAQKCGMHTAEMPNASRNNAECIPQNRGSNSIEDYIDDQDIEDRHNEVTNLLSSDNATPSEIRELIAYLQAKLEQSENTPDIPLTPAGSITAADGENSQEIPADHNATQSPAIDEKQGLTQESAVIAHQEKETPEIAPQTQETPSSTQTVKDLSNQATEQEQQASGDHRIATGATKKSAPQNPRRSKSAGKEEKPQLSSEEKAKEAERLEKHRIIYNSIVQRRGGEVDPDKIGLERKFVNKLIERGYSPERVDRFHQFLEEEDWRYCKTIDGKKRITAQVIFNEARTIEMTLADPNYRPSKKGNQRNSSAMNARSVAPASPKASMTHDEACKLAHDAIVQAKQYGYDIQAQAVSSTKIEGAWLVKVKWENVRNIPVPLIKTRKQWEEEFQSIHEVLNMQLTPVAERQAK